MESISQGVRFQRGGVFMKTNKQKSREYMHIIKKRTELSIMYINYMMKLYWSAINTETKAESGFQSAT